MEQKKTLWIIAATGVFLLVVIGAAMLLYSPSNYEKPAIASLPTVQQIPSGGWVAPIPQTSNDTVDLSSQYQTVTNSTITPPQVIVQKDNESTSSNQMKQVENLTVISNNTSVYDVGTAKTTTIDLNTLKEEATKYEEPTTPTVKKAEPVKVAEPVKPVETVKKQTTVATAKTTVASKPAVTKAEPLAPSYWVQAASFTAKKLADNARSVLAENQIPAEVFTYTDAKKQTYFRVRVGPYTTKSEAEYWKSKIIQVDEFKDSQAYVTNSSAVK